MKKNPSFDYNEEFEQQLLTEEEFDKVKAKSFINLISEMFIKYENEIENTIISN